MNRTTITLLQHSLNEDLDQLEDIREREKRAIEVMERTKGLREDLEKWATDILRSLIEINDLDSDTKRVIEKGRESLLGPKKGGGS